MPITARMPDGSLAQIEAVELPESFETGLQSWDMAFKDLNTSDYVVGQVWGQQAADRFLLHQIRERLDFPATLRAVRKMTQDWPLATTKLVEDKANGAAVIATLKHEISGLIEVNPEGGKEARASAVSPQIESGNVYLPHPSVAAWVDGYLAEWAAFPRGAHDDQVDATTQALNRMRDDHRPGMLVYLELELKRVNPTAWEAIRNKKP